MTDPCVSKQSYHALLKKYKLETVGLSGGLEPKSVTVRRGRSVENATPSPAIPLKRGRKRAQPEPEDQSKESPEKQKGTDVQDECDIGQAKGGNAQNGGRAEHA